MCACKKMRRAARRKWSRHAYEYHVTRIMGHGTRMNESWHTSNEVQRLDIKSDVLQCVAVCCSVLQCVAVCCSVLQCVAERSHVSPAKGYGDLILKAMCCSV